MCDDDKGETDSEGFREKSRVRSRAAAAAEKTSQQKVDEEAKELGKKSAVLNTEDVQENAQRGPTSAAHGLFVY